MNYPANPAGPHLDSLLNLFPTKEEVAECEYVAAEKVPPPYYNLLVHNHHMTVTVEAYHGDLVNVRILSKLHKGDAYSRKILLALQGNGKVVQYGIMRVHFRYCSPAVRDEILAGKTPLGRILIQHNVLRRVEPTAFLRIIPGPALMRAFGIDQPTPTYGRLALIHCDGYPAVEVLEIVIPA
jgi:chorismate-pyruvate lyase